MITSEDLKKVEGDHFGVLLAGVFVVMLKPKIQGIIPCFNPNP